MEWAPEQSMFNMPAAFDKKVSAVRTNIRHDTQLIVLTPYNDKRVVINRDRKVVT